MNDFARPMMKSSHSGSSTSSDAGVLRIRYNALPTPKTGLKGLVQRPKAAPKPKLERLPRPKRATPKNMRDIALAEMGRVHMHSQIENFDQEAMFYCGIILGQNDRRLALQRFIVFFIKGEASRKCAADREAVFTGEDAKAAAKSAYDEIAAGVLKMIESQRFEKRASLFVREQKAPSKQVQKPNRPKYINTPHMVA